MPTRSRREMLRLLPGAAIAIGASRVLTACGDASPVPPDPSLTGTSAPTSTPEANTAPPKPLTRLSHVAASRGTDLRKMTREALEAIGGIGTIVSPGHRVFIKPNLVTAGSAGTKAIFRNGECAKPEIVLSVAEECLKAGASEVVIGDGAQVARFDWARITTMDGATNMPAEAARLASAYGGTVTLACLNADTPEWVEVPTKTKLGTIAISSLVARADRVISIPVIKTHTLAGLSLSIKNFMGVISSDRHGGYPYRAQIHTAGIEQSFVDVVTSLRPHLAVIDGSICCEANGPTVDPQNGRGRTVDMKERLGSWLVLVSTDLLAADATAARIVSHDPASLKQFPLAHAQGVGQLSETAIELVGARLADLRVPWQPAQLQGAAT